MTRPVPSRAVHGIEAITFDFGNTLVPVDRAALRRVAKLTAERVAVALGPFSVATFLKLWGEERERQFREEVPQLREVDLAVRFTRVLARLRGLPAPPPSTRWDDATTAAFSTVDEIVRGVEVYSSAFVEAIPVPAGVAPALERLAATRKLAILSNWPHAATVDRYVAAAGWDRWLGPIVVSQRVGTIKPDPAIFEAAIEALGHPSPGDVLHVGDDWVADVVGAKRSGLRAAFVTHRPARSPLPSSPRDGSVVPDFEVESITQLADLLAAE